MYFGAVENSYKKELNNLKAKIEEMNSKIQINQSDIKETENVKDNISTNDLFALDKQDMLLAKIVDGDLFYWLGNSSDNSTFFTTTSSESFYTKVDSNVRRIKTFMLGTDTSISFLAIKEDGSVYIMKVAYDDNMKNRTLKYEEYEPFKGLQIDDIILIRGYAGVSVGVNATVKLLDGTEINVNKTF